MENEDEDFDIDDILKNYGKKKPKNSGRKGKRGERLLVKILEKRFNLPFSRTVGSGARICQAHLTETAKRIFTGDLVTPDNFLFVFEAKNGYNEIDLERAINRLTQGKSGNSQLDKFLKQSERDANKIHRKPMMCWKKDYQPWLAFMKKEHVPEEVKDQRFYKEWSIVELEKFLLLPDHIFLKEEK